MGTQTTARISANQKLEWKIVEKERVDAEYRD